MIVEVAGCSRVAPHPASPLRPACSDPDHYLGCTSVNVWGTQMALYDWGMPVDLHALGPLDEEAGEAGGVGGPAGPLLGHPGGVLPGLGRRELARVLYDSNILATVRTLDDGGGKDSQVSVVSWASPQPFPACPTRRPPTA